MDCGICFEENIDITKIHFMECLHHVCQDCFKSITVNSCPYCRYNITTFYESSNSDEEYIYSEEIIIPLARKNRQERKRNKVEKRLRKIMENMTENHTNILPNIRTRINKKMTNL